MPVYWTIVSSSPQSKRVILPIMRVLMVGGTGFIGPYVARELHESGHEVTLFHRGQHESVLLPPVRHFRSGEGAMPVLTFPQDLVRAGFEVVIHMIPTGEADTRAAVHSFTGRAQPLVVLSSGDVYRAYGRFTGIELGPVEEGLLTEDSPLRNVHYPYRSLAKSPDELNYFYEKLLVERQVRGQSQLPTTVLRLPKVYGPGGNANLATIYGYHDQLAWRWTHGYVENVAAAIVLAALHPAAARPGEYSFPTPRAFWRRRLSSTVNVTESTGPEMFCTYTTPSRPLVGPSQQYGSNGLWTSNQVCTRMAYVRSRRPQTFSLQR
jgi:nucleoside-diphosphate-sugar epimerase